MNTVNNLGFVYWKKGRLMAAEESLRQAFAAVSSKLGSAHPRLARSHWGLAGVLRDQGRLAEAEPHFKRAPQTKLRTQPINNEERTKYVDRRRARQ
jgi:non-specific serine/threonine protein kinase/serine/threonine-protein kinase